MGGRGAGLNMIVKRGKPLAANETQLTSLLTSSDTALSALPQWTTNGYHAIPLHCKQMQHSVSLLCVGSHTVFLPSHTWGWVSEEHSYVRTAHSPAHLVPCLGKTAATELISLYLKIMVSLIPVKGYKSLCFCSEYHQLCKTKFSVFSHRGAL